MPPVDILLALCTFVHHLEILVRSCLSGLQQCGAVPYIDHKATGLPTVGRHVLVLVLDDV